MGLDEIPQGKGGTLFLPNHPAEMDPIIMARLWKSHRPRPVVLETFYHMPFANRIMKIMRAFPMPDMTTGTGFTKKGASMKRSQGYPMPWKGGFRPHVPVRQTDALEPGIIGSRLGRAKNSGINR